MCLQRVDNYFEKTICLFSRVHSGIPTFRTLDFCSKLPTTTQTKSRFPSFVKLYIFTLGFSNPFSFPFNKSSKIRIALFFNLSHGSKMPEGNEIQLFVFSSRKVNVTEGQSVNFYVNVRETLFRAKRVLHD